MKKLILCLLLFVAAAGCEKSLPVTPVPVQVSNLKQQMTGLSQTGYLGSGAENVRQAFEELEKSDPAKAATVKKDLDDLFRADGNEAKVKQLAKAISEKL